jgi:imidazolonepropionase-like amidohydrolase
LLKTITKLRLVLFAICFWPAVWVNAETTVFVNVNVVPMDSERVLRQQSVVVVDGLITTVASVDEVSVPKGAMIIDGTDRFLMPGLAEMHAHVTSTEPDQVQRLSTLFVANGVTTIRGMLGRSSHLKMREQFASGEIFGPRLITSGPSFNGRSVSGPADASRQVREQHAAGYDFIKVHPGLTQEEFVALAETANELGMPFAGHVPAAAGLGEALRLGMSTIDHLDGYFAALIPPTSSGAGGYGGWFDVMLAAELDADRIAAIAITTRDAGVWNVPTQVLIEQMIDATPAADLRNRTEMRYVSAATVNEWLEARNALRLERGFDPAIAALAVDTRRRLILALHSSGAGLLLGSDAPQSFNVPGFSLHRELQALVAAGLSPFDALSSGTTAVASFLNSNGGYVMTGKNADLILLDANPLADIHNSQRIHGVMLRGRWYSNSELNAALAALVVQTTQ